MFNRQAVLQQSTTYDSFYMYDEAAILDQTDMLTKTFENVTFLYSVKANPHPLVLRTVLSQGFGADAASLNEVLLCKQLGALKENIYYSAPGKSARDIAAALEHCVIIADSLNEIALINAAAQNQNIVAEIGIRINPDFTFYAQTGMPAKFGIDEGAVFESLPYLNSLSHVRVVGIHVHSRSQELDAQILLNYYQNMTALAGKVEEALGEPLQFINLGSGIGIPYRLEDKPLDIQALGSTASGLFKRYILEHPRTRLMIETGRFVTCKAGVYVTKVLDKKVSFGKTFVILCNTLNGFIKPSVSQIVAGYAASATPFSSEPLYTGADAHQIIPLTEETEQECVTLSGNLCTAIDLIAKDILLPKLKIGDILVINNAGSYAAAISPMQFSSQTPPAELFFTKGNTVINYRCGPIMKDEIF